MLVEIDRLLGDAADHDAIAEHVEERGHKKAKRIRRRAAEKPDHRHCRLLRACAERPRDPAPPSSVMNSRRLNRLNCICCPSQDFEASYRINEDQVRDPGQLTPNFEGLQKKWIFLAPTPPSHTVSEIPTLA